MTLVFYCILDDVHFVIELTTFTCLRLSLFYFLKELGLIRKPSSFMSSICDERGAELLYAGMPITEVFKVQMLKNNEIISQIM